MKVINLEIVLNYVQSFHSCASYLLKFIYIIYLQIDQIIMKIHDYNI